MHRRPPQPAPIHYAPQPHEFVLTPQQAQQIQQSLVNRYATIGRNYHLNANVSNTADQTRVDVHHHHYHQKGRHRSHDNLAMRINNNLTSSQTLAMKAAEAATPLTDVRQLIGNVQLLSI